MELYNGRDIFLRHLNFLESVMATNNWGDDERRRLSRAIVRLKERINDPCVNISVIGEFSSGKSSMINALLGINLLETDELPDTTLVPAVLVYGSQPAFEIQYLDGKKKTFKGSLETIREKLYEYNLPTRISGEGLSQEEYLKKLTAARRQAEKRSASIKQFVISLPSNFLKCGFRLIDTPGLSSNNRRCAKMAENTMKETDYSIIVASATNGVLVESIRTYLSDTIKDRLAYCAVVFTRFDLVSRRDKMKTYLRTVVPGFFDLTPKELPVYMAVPPTVTAALEGKKFGDEHAAMLKVTRDTIDQLIANAVERREKAIANSLVRLTREVYTLLNAEIPKIKKRHEDRLAQLDRSSKFPVAKTVAKKRERHETHLHAKKAEYLAKLDVSLMRDIAEMKRVQRNSVMGKKTIKEIDTHLKTYLTPEAEYRIKKMSDSGTFHLEEFLKAMKVELSEFQLRMRKEFRELGIADVDLQLTPPQHTSSMVASNEFGAIIKMGENEASGQSGAIALSIIGGIIGSVVLFGLGTAIGSALGALIGGGGKKYGIDDVKKRVVPEMEKKLDEGLGKHKTSVSNWYTTEANNLIIDFSHLLDGYEEKYRKKLTSMKRDEEKKQKSVREEINRLEQTLKQIKINQEELDNLWILK